MTHEVLGVDGARGGWIAARLRVDDGSMSLDFHTTIEPLITELVDRSHAVEILAVDMPIGLSSTGNRPVDQQVRTRLGPRSSTFFPTPIRSVLDFDEYAVANEHSKSVYGSGLSKQAWNLVPKIAEIDGLWTEQLANRLLEAHPETSFAEMSGSPVMSKKSTPEGHAERALLLDAVLPCSISELLAAAPKRFAIDIVDAIALAWTARRAYVGRAVQLGGDLDEANRPMRLTI